MRLSRKLLRAAIGVSLALLFAIISIIRLPQTAFGFVSASVGSIASDYQQQQDISINRSLSLSTISNAEASVKEELLLDFFCVVTKSFPKTEFDTFSTSYIRDKVISNLAKQLQGSECVKSHRSDIGEVDFQKLVNVIYNTKIVNDSAVVMVAVGPKLPSSLPGTLGIVGPSDGNAVKVEIVDDRVNGVAVAGNYGVDGANLKQGVVVNLRVKATDRAGKNISSNAVWKNAEGQTIGQGATLVYPQNQIKNETVTVIVTASNGQKSYAGRSWTVEPGDVIVAKNVKPLGGEAQRSITDLDFKEGRVCLRNEAFRTDIYKGVTGLPTIKKGDVLLGAGDSVRKDYILPPVKVLNFLPSKGGETCLKTEFASLEEVIVKTQHQFPITQGGLPTQLKYSNSGRGVDLKLPFDSDLDMEKGWPNFVSECNRKGYKYRWDNRNNLDTNNQDGQYKGGLPTPDNIIPPPSQQYKFKILKEEKTEAKEVNTSGKNTSNNFKAVATKKTYNLDANVYLGYDFNPEVSGDIGFDGGLKLRLNTAATETLMGGISLEGLYRLEKYYLAKDTPKKLASLEGLEAPRIAFSIGPIPVWIDFPLILDFYFQSFLEMKLQGGVLGFLQTGSYKLDFVYENGSFQFPREAESLSAAMFCGNVAVSGEARPSLTPRVQFLLYSVAGPQLGLEGYVRGNLTTPQRQVNIAPISASTNTYQASMGQAVEIPITINSGIDLKAQMISASEVIFPPYKLTILDGKCLPYTKWCSKPIAIEFDINKYFKKWFEFKFNILKGKEVKASIPLTVAPFSDWLKDSPMNDATVLWESDKSGAFATTDLSAPVNLCSLPAGKHSITATIFAPWDVNLQNQLGKKGIDVDIKSDGCSST